MIIITAQNFVPCGNGVTKCQTIYSAYLWNNDIAQVSLISTGKSVYSALDGYCKVKDIDFIVYLTHASIEYTAIQEWIKGV